MRPALLHRQTVLLGMLGALILAAPSTPARGAPADARGRAGVAISESTWVDHDRRPIQKPPEWEPSYWGSQVHQGFFEPVSHLFDIPDKLLWGARKREAVNVNSFDEVPNSSWFTNRNHMRAVPVAALREGPDPVSLPDKPWTITHPKESGFSSGFQIKDAKGRKWLVKLDPRDYPQLTSGADMVSRTLMHAAGYNVPHNTPVRFHRGDVKIDEKLLRGTEGEQMGEADLDSVLAQGAKFPDGSYSAFASLFLPGKPVGAPSMERLRPGDSNDWYTHRNRRELRGLYVLFAWINNWDAKDHQWLDMFVETQDSLGHVKHYLLDVGSSLGAAARGPKGASSGYEYAFDMGWTARRIFSLGFAKEPWRTDQETGIPSVGRLESEKWKPKHFKPRLPNPLFRETTAGDGYWAAKIVASFSDAQIAAAVDAAGYDDPRARDFLVRNLIIRRDKIAKHWFSRVAPLDFFWVQNGTLRFRDLAVDVGLANDRSYEVDVEARGGGPTGGGTAGGRGKRVRLRTPALPLLDFGTGASHLSLTISVDGSGAKPTHVELARRGNLWIVTRVRHG